MLVVPIDPLFCGTDAVISFVPAHSCTREEPVAVAVAVAAAATEEADQPGVRRWGLLNQKKAEAARWGGGERVPRAWWTRRCHYCESTTAVDVDVTVAASASAVR